MEELAEGMFGRPVILFATPALKCFILEDSSVGGSSNSCMSSGSGSAIETTEKLIDKRLAKRQGQRKY